VVIVVTRGRRLSCFLLTTRIKSLPAALQENDQAKTADQDLVSRAFARMSLSGRVGNNKPPLLAPPVPSKVLLVGPWTTRRESFELALALVNRDQQ